METYSVIAYKRHKHGGPLQRVYSDTIKGIMKVRRKSIKVLNEFDADFVDIRIVGESIWYSIFRIGKRCAQMEKSDLNKCYLIHKDGTLGPKYVNRKKNKPKRK